MPIPVLSFCCTALSHFSRLFNMTGDRDDVSGLTVSKMAIGGTELRFSGEHCSSERAGIYCSAAGGLPLFSSADKMKTRSPPPPLRPCQQVPAPLAALHSHVESCRIAWAAVAGRASPSRSTLPM